MSTTEIPRQSSANASLSHDGALRVLHAASEAYPLIKTGGLADVAGALPNALRELGVDARLLLPGYPVVLDALMHDCNCDQPVVPIGTVLGVPNISLRQATMPGSDLPIIAIDAPSLFRREGSPYTNADGADWPDNPVRFALLGWVAAHIAQSQLLPDWQPQVVHAHDWHAALAMTYLKQNPATNCARVFTIHNLAYQGRCHIDNAARLMIDPELMVPQHLEFHGDLSFMKAGIDGADLITTVSPSYAHEILTPRFGEGLDGVLRTHADHVSGILNGIDARQWDPGNDGSLPCQYNEHSLTGKRTNKAALQKRLGLAQNPQQPLLGIVSRMTAQKGQDLVLANIDQLLAENCQLAILGTGDPAIESAFASLGSKHPHHISYTPAYDEMLAHQIFAAADMILVPSQFEPCGLTQQYALRYGSVPVVRSVGGLADTVFDFDNDGPGHKGQPVAASANGFTFETDAQFMPTMRRALRWHEQSDQWRRLMLAGMRQEFGWLRAARQYLDQYQAACGHIG